MKKALIIAYDFPPTGGGGVLRMLKFAKYLPEFDWQPEVVSLENRLQTVRDVLLLKELSDSVVVHYTPSLEPFRLTKIYRALGGGIGYSGSEGAWKKNTKRGLLSYLWQRSLTIPQNFLFPDKGIFWVYPAIRRAARIMGSGIDLIMTSSPPHSVHLIGRYLRRRHQVPWVIDFRDGWTSIPLYSHGNRFLRRWELRMERDILTEADGVVAATAPITSHLKQRLSAMHTKKFVTITNGFDWDDLKPVEYRRRERLVFTHTGVIGGVRSTTCLFDALKMIKYENPEVYKDLKFQFVGRFTDDMAPWRRELTDCFVHLPYQPHKKTFSILQESDVLFILIQWDEGGNTFLTTKFFDYLPCKRPILAMIPQSPLKDLIEKHELGKVVCPDDTFEIKNAILYFHSLWMVNQLYTNPSEELLSRFERRSLTESLARFFDRVVEDHRGRTA